MQNCELKTFLGCQGNYPVWLLVCAVIDFPAEFIRGRFSVAFAVLTAEKHAPKIREISVEHLVRTFCFSVRFSVHFSVHFSVRFR